MRSAGLPGDSGRATASACLAALHLRDAAVYCRRGEENLCPRSHYTGWDADGGYAEFAVVPEAYVYRLPEDRSTTTRWHRCCVPGSSAIARCAAAASRPAAGSASTASAASAHLTAQVALAQGGGCT